MNPHLPDYDPEIEALLREHAVVIERYRALPTAEPGAHLDAAILKQAALAVQRPLRRRPWLVPMASAASLVAAAGIGWRVHLANTVEPAAAPRAERYQVLEVELNPPSERERAVQTTVLPVPAAELPKRADAPRSQAASAPDSLDAIVQSPAKDRGIEFEPHTQPDHAGIGQLPEQRALAASPAAAEEAVPAAAPVMASNAAAKLEMTEPSADNLSEVEVDSGTVERKPAGRQVDQSAANAAQNQGKATLSAAAWIQNIRVLIRQRRLPQARAEIRALQIAYPELVLPGDLERYRR